MAIRTLSIVMGGAPVGENAASGTPATTSTATSVTYDGVTFNFDRSLTIGSFVGGEPFVISSEAFNITSITPASSDIEGDGDVGNGAMKDPYVPGADQGFDDYIASSVVGGMRFGNTTYNSSLNIDPGNSGVDIAIALNEETTIVKSVRLSSVTSPESWQTIEKYVPLTVLSAIPDDNAFMPTMSGTTKKLYYEDDASLNVFRDLTLPGSFTTTYADALGDVPDNLGMFGSTGEKLRRFRLDNALGTASSNYSANVAGAYWRLMMWAHNTSATTSQKQDIARICAKFAIQLEGLYDRGWRGAGGLASGAGQQHGFHNWFYTGAFYLKSSLMLTKAKAVDSGMVSMHSWADSSYTGYADEGDSGTISQVFFEEQEGVPFILPSQIGSNVDTRYGVIGGTASARELLPVLALRNGPAGESGPQALLNGDSFDSTSQRAASIAFLDRFRTWVPWVMGSDDPTGEWRDMYDLVQPLTGLTAWTGPPDQIPYGTASGYDGNDQFTQGAAGEIDWDFTGYDYATETVTSRDVRYSLDGVQWIESTGVALSGKLSGLMQGASHQLGFRLNSASGAGPWSLNYDYDGIGNSPDRGVVTTSGTPSNSGPSFATSPTIHQRLYGYWDYALWEAAPSTLGLDDIELACGLGYQASSVYPAPTYTFQWKRGGVDISGATSQTYTRTAADAGAVLTCEITATNSTSSTSVTTAGVTCPALTTLPSGTLIDTDFTGRFLIDYETMWGNRSMSNATGVALPDLQLFGVSGVTKGAIQVDKTGSFPRIELAISQPDTATETTYRVEATVVAGLFNDWDGGSGSGNADFRIYSSGVGSDYVNNTISQTTEGESNVVTVDETFVVAAGDTDLDILFRHILDTNLGGTGGGDLYVTSLKVSEVA